jgi:putative transposase
MLLDWRPKIRAFVNFCLADRINSYEQAYVCGSYCELESKREVLVSPLTCSVNRSASVGYPWRSGDPKLRRAKDKTKPQNLKRSAYEMHSACLTETKQARPWYKTVSTDVLQQALLNLDKAFQNFFSGKSKFPRFKRTTDINFEFKPGTVRIEGNNITFPVLGRMRFYPSRQIPKSWAVKTCTISIEPDGYYVSVRLEDKTVPDIPLKKGSELNTVAGVDVGIIKIASTSDGEIVPNPRFLKKHQRQLAIRQRSLSRKKKGSNNRGKAGKRVARVHQAIRRERNDYGWKLAKKLAQKADVIAFEDLNVKAMMKRCKPKKDEVIGKYLKNGQSRKVGLNKAIADASWHSLRLKTQHQASKLGNRVVLVNPRHTSQQCSCCGYISPKNRDKEKFLCEACNHYADADVDGAVVIAQKAAQNLGIASLRVVSPKVMPDPELTGNPKRKEISLPLGGEPRNQTRKEEYVQLSLFHDLSGESKTIPRSG